MSDIWIDLYISTDIQTGIYTGLTSRFKLTVSH